MKSIKLLAVAIIMTAFYGCEKCSECTYTTYGGTCSYDFLGTTFSQDYDNLTEAEYNEIKSACGIIGSFTSNNEDETKDVCGKKKDVEEEVDDMEDDGWSCGTIE